MRRSAACIMLCVWAVAAWAGYGHLQPSRYGDARYAALLNRTVTNIEYTVNLPSGRHEAFTVVAWMRLVNTNRNSFLTTTAVWCPDPVIKSSPDLLFGVGAYGVNEGTDLTALGGAITVSSFPFATYTNAYLAGVTNTWKRGVYTIAGWASNAVTVSLGGVDYSFGPGSFNANRTPGVADSVVISGAGPVSVGISRTPCHRYFQEIDGVFQEKDMISGFVTNEITMCVWRFKMDGTNQIYRSDMGNLAAFNELSQTKTNAMPESACFDSRGYYRVGLLGVIRFPRYDHDIFGTRVLPWWLTDQELERIHFNDSEELNRRGIPQWR